MALISSMACRVFRNLRLEHLKEQEIHSTIPGASLASGRSYTQRFILDTGEMVQPTPAPQDCPQTAHLELRDVLSRGRSTEWEAAEIVNPICPPQAGFPSGIRASRGSPKVDSGKW